MPNDPRASSGEGFTGAGVGVCRIREDSVGLPWLQELNNRGSALNTLLDKIPAVAIAG